MDAYKLDNETHVGHSWSDGHTRNMKCDHKLQEKDINLMRSKNLSKFMAFEEISKSLHSTIGLYRRSLKQQSELKSILFIN